MARPERLELPTYWFEASRSIRLSYGRVDLIVSCGHNMLETEIKLRIAEGADAARRLLETHRFRVTIPRLLEVNQVFDLPDLTMLRSGKLLRVRSTAGKAILPYKGPALPGP